MDCRDCYSDSGHVYTFNFIHGPLMCSSMDGCGVVDSSEQVVTGLESQVLSAKATQPTVTNFSKNMQYSLLSMSLFNNIFVSKGYIFILH